MFKIYDSTEDFTGALSDIGITLEVSDETLKECVFWYEDTCDQDEDEFYFNQLIEYRHLCEEGKGDWSVYSDLYKDVYGVRPH